MLSRPAFSPPARLTSALYPESPQYGLITKSVTESLSHLSVSPTLHATTFEFASFLEKNWRKKGKPLPNGHLPVTVKPRKAWSVERIGVAYKPRLDIQSPTRVITRRTGKGALGGRISRLSPQLGGASSSKYRGGLPYLWVRREVQGLLSRNFHNVSAKDALKSDIRHSVKTACWKPVAAALPKVVKTGRAREDTARDDDESSICSWKAEF